MQEAGDVVAAAHAGEGEVAERVRGRGVRDVRSVFGAHELDAGADERNRRDAVEHDAAQPSAGTLRTERRGRDGDEGTARDRQAATAHALLRLVRFRAVYGRGMKNQCGGGPSHSRRRQSALPNAYGPRSPNVSQASIDPDVNPRLNHA